MHLKVAYKQKHDAEKGLSDYAHMKEPPEVRHAMEVNKRQSNVSKLILLNFLGGKNGFRVILLRLKDRVTLVTGALTLFI